MNKLLDRTFYKLVCVIELVRILKLWELIIKPEKRVGKEKTVTLYSGNKDLINSEVTRSSEEAFKKYNFQGFVTCNFNSTNARITPKYVGSFITVEKLLYFFKIDLY